jgi:hypothetical protein
MSKRQRHHWITSKSNLMKDGIQSILPIAPRSPSLRNYQNQTQMNPFKTDLKDSVSRLLNEHGIKNVLQAIAEDVADRERIIKEENDRNLSGAVEFMFPVLVQALPKTGKRLGSFIRSVLKSRPVVESLKVINADSPNHSQSVREAWVEWKKL